MRLGQAQVLRPARAVLGEHGWRKQPGLSGIFFHELRPGVRAWLALGGRWDKQWHHLDLEPGIGVRHDEAERRASGLLGREPGAAPTVMGRLDQLLPHRRHTEEWRLTGDEEHDAATWAALVADLDEHAWPWWQDRTGDEQLVASIREGEGNDTARLVLPLLLMSLGRTDDARRAVEAGRGRRTGLVLDYDAYAARVLTLLDPK